MKFKQVIFNQSFQYTIDELLSDVFQGMHYREDFLGFFYFFDHQMAYSDSEWVQFDIANTRSLFGRHNQQWKLSAIIRILIEKNILESTTYYFDLRDKTNSTTRKYRYTDNFLRKVINEDIKFSTGNISYKTYERLTRENTPSKPHLLAQYNILLSDRFSILDTAAQWLVENYRILTKNSFQVNMRSLMSLDNKDNIYVKQDDKTGRVFTNFVCLKRELRQFCKIDGEHLQSLDLKSAQPTFLAHQLLEQYPTSEDVKHFYEIVTKDDIYDYLDKHYFFREYYEEFNMPTTLRDQSKVEFMRWIFSDSRGSAGYSKVIKKEFPDVWRFVQDGKNRYRKMGSNYALELQKIEAKIFIDGPLGLFQEGVLSVHDSLYFKPGLKGLVEDALSEALVKNKIYSFKLS